MTKLINDGRVSAPLTSDQNLILKDHDQFNEEKIKRELTKDKEWLEVVEENRKL